MEEDVAWELSRFYDSYYRYPQSIEEFIEFESLFAKIQGECFETFDVNAVLDSVLYTDFDEHRILEIRSKYGYVYSVLHFLARNKNDLYLIHSEDGVTIKSKVDKFEAFCFINYCHSLSIVGATINVAPGLFTRFYDESNKRIWTEDDIISKFYNGLRKIRYEYKIKNPEEKHFKTFLLRYNKKEGLSSMCPDELSLEEISLLKHIEEYFYEYLSVNQDIFEIIVPLIAR